ncbi:trypsin-like peptidase domain-containing protein [Bacillaceae bacterium S4-13-56]
MKQSIYKIMSGVIVGAFLMLLIIPEFMNDEKEKIVDNEEIVANANTEKTDVKLIKTNDTEVFSAIVDAIDKNIEAVVGVVNIQVTNGWPGTFGAGPSSNEAGTGSGVIYKKEDGKAYVVTNYHVVEGAQELDIILHDESRVPGKLVGTDPLTDLAVIAIDGENVTKTASFGSSDTLKIGEPVIAIGNPLGADFSGSATQGIISGLERTVPVDLDGNGTSDWQAEVLQTDAAINPGNSGGALININGDVIGINSMKIAQEAVEGIGFAIPANMVTKIITDIEEQGEVKRPFMGIQAHSLTEIPTYYWQQALKLPEVVNKGVVIAAVTPLSPVDEAGLQENDVIVQLDDQPVGNLLDLRKYLYQEKEIGDDMEVTFYRNGQKQSATITLTEQIDNN